MKLDDFHNLVLSEIIEFRKDYLEKRQKEPHPDKSFPLSLSQNEWFFEFQTFLVFKKASEKVQKLEELESFNFEDNS